MQKTAMLIPISFPPSFIHANIAAVTSATFFGKSDARSDDLVHLENSINVSWRI
ncbi:hypothetical protein FRACYDRAFT_221178 [Fragilariopsis cylindrus CCMP1102]|uniref:Uncharacterized protein n=1 Tax=Fragilariopsis cylindrus CCMP1102 TaxID=635003 RepID=A0A1E7ENK2_9STRA|nr:hypothetical protein FRACYDRAFT_221178 [Fragilariopsis cylindrus CCMP1102]|eukprot:OEU07549.1 hypothetical protein FRACYDRAFT_221178 [Fragilariopsis cylindrus CCMP1102]